jgi:hypothetical protein
LGNLQLRRNLHLKRNLQQRGHGREALGGDKEELSIEGEVDLLLRRVESHGGFFLSLLLV